jgi:hypothetical protein
MDTGVIEDRHFGHLLGKRQSETIGPAIADSRPWPCL